MTPEEELEALASTLVNSRKIIREVVDENGTVLYTIFRGVMPIRREEPDKETP
jgi:hypothetical protein